MNPLKLLAGAAILIAFLAPALYWVAPGMFFDAVVRIERLRSGLHLRHADLPGGHRIAYLDSEDAAPPLVLVHGFGGDKDHWTRVARPLRGTVRVIAPDLPGYGDSSAPAAGDYGLDAQVEHLRAFLDHLGLTRVELGGSSMGGNIAARFTARYPNRVGSLWLIANSGVDAAPPSEARRQIEAGGPNPLIATTAEAYGDLIAWVMAQPPVIPERMRQVLADRAIAVQALRRHQFGQLYDAGAEPLESLMRGLPVPTHLLWGEADRVLHPEGAALLAAVLPQASLTRMPGIGHLPMIEAPQATAEDYLAFRATLQPARP